MGVIYMPPVICCHGIYIRYALMVYVIILPSALFICTL